MSEAWSLHKQSSSWQEAFIHLPTLFILPEMNPDLFRELFSNRDTSESDVCY